MYVLPRLAASLRWSASRLSSTSFSELSAGEAPGSVFRTQLRLLGHVPSVQADAYLSLGIAWQPGDNRGRERSHTDIEPG